MNLFKLLLFVMILLGQCSSPTNITIDNQLLGTWCTKEFYFSNITYDTLTIQRNIFTLKETGYIAIMNGVNAMQYPGTWSQHADSLYIAYTGTTDSIHVYFHLYSNGNKAEDVLGLFGFLYNRVN